MWKNKILPHNNCRDKNLIYQIRSSQLLYNTIKNSDKIISLEELEKKISSIDFNNINQIISEEIAEEVIKHYFFNLYKNILENKNEDIILNRIKQLNNIILYQVIINPDQTVKKIYKLIDRQDYNNKLSNNYRLLLKNILEKPPVLQSPIQTKVSLPDFNYYFWNFQNLNGVNQGNFVDVPQGNHRQAKIIPANKGYYIGNEKVINKEEITIYPIKRLSLLSNIQKFILSPYNRNILGFGFNKYQIMERLKIINNSSNNLKQLILTIFLDYILLYISDLTQNLKNDLNIGLLVKGGLAYRFYNKNHIPSDFEIYLGKIKNDNICIDELENYNIIFKYIIDNFQELKINEFSNENLTKLVNKFFDDLDSLGINFIDYSNIYNFYEKLKLNQINFDINIITNNQLLKLVIKVNDKIIHLMDFNINDKLKAINDYGLIKKIDPLYLENKYKVLEKNINLMYLQLKDKIDNTYYPQTTISQELFDSRIIFNVLSVEFLIHQKKTIIFKLLNNLYFGLISDDLLEIQKEIEKNRLILKSQKIIYDHYHYDFYAQKFIASKYLNK